MQPTATETRPPDASISSAPSEGHGHALITWEQRDPEAEVLVVTNMWPDAERPVFGIFIKRQIDSVRAAGIPCDVLYVRGYRGIWAYPLAAAKMLWSSLAWRKRYKLVHVHAGETVLAARFHLGTPMLASYCGDDLLGTLAPDGKPLGSSLIRSALIRRHARFLTGTITKSAQMEQVLPKAVRSDNEVLPNGVDTSVFAPMDRREAREQLGWDPDERVVLFAATRPSDPNKRLGLAEAACRLAERQLGSIRLHVAGNTHPAEMPVLMNAADCLMLTSAVEGSPNVVKEALMCDLPVVSTAVGDVETLLSNVSPSHVCESDPERLAEALVECLAAPRRSNGREASGHLSTEATTARLLGIYSALANDWKDSRP
jgi:teichuronic acid biosynthesis glycosyltransferase TuaC